MSHSRIVFAPIPLRLLGFVAACVLVVSLSSTPAFSDPIIDLSWDACSPLVHDRVLPAGETTSNLYISTTGMELAHKAYQFKMLFGTHFDCGPYGGVPDAWRFDVTGCQGTSLWSAFLTSTSKACPALAGAPSQSVKIIDMAYGASVGAMQLTVTYSYPPQVPDPNQRYQLARILFDHTYAVTGAGTPGETCGGFEQPMCFSLWGGEFRGFCLDHANAIYLDTADNQHNFQLRNPGDVNSFRIDPSIQACNLTTPAHPTTWGSIKAQYR